MRLGIVFPPRKEEYQEQAGSPRKSGTVAPEQNGHIPIVSFEKVVALVWHYLVEDEISADNMKSAFTTFDVDGDGSLQSSEVEQVCRYAHEHHVLEWMCFIAGQQNFRTENM